jgi:hypothetical protein
VGKRQPRIDETSRHGCGASSQVRIGRSRIEPTPVRGDTCPRSSARLGFEPENLLYVLEDFTVEVHCESEAANLNCSVPKQTADGARNLGAPCEPTPINGAEFDITETYLEPDAQHCGSGMCMAFHLEGSIAPDCDPLTQTCVDEILLRDRAVCTCRCSADDPGDAELCTVQTITPVPRCFEVVQPLAATV